ncbi:MAG: type VII toxin-antitoxin system HepT family RNase toxin [Saccharospirillum sp.]
MADDVILNKCATIERCVKRVIEEWTLAGDQFDTDYTRQDAAILNIQRACEAAIDLGQHIVRRDKLGLPQSARDIFTVLQSRGVIPAQLAESLKRMVGFRNIAVHDYQTLALPIVKAIIHDHLGDFTAFSQHILKSDNNT